MVTLRTKRHWSGRKCRRRSCFAPPFLVVRGIISAWRSDPEFRTLVVIVLITLLSGTIFYSWVEGWSVVDALLFSVTTLTTVGYGNLVPTTTISKLFTVIYIFAGISIILGFIDTVATKAKMTKMLAAARGQYAVPYTNFRAHPFHSVRE